MDQDIVHIVSFSGGRTSAYLVYLMEQKRIEEGLDVRYVFCDTGAEHPLTYKFIRDVVNYFGIDLVCLRAKVTPEMGIGITYEVIPIEEIGFNLTVWKQMIAKYSTPNVQGPICTDKLKYIPFDKWRRYTFKKKKIKSIQWVGIRADEARRLKVKKGVQYLADISDFEKQDVLDFWKSMPFDLELRHECLGNCVFCIKKNVSKIALAQRFEPEMFSEITQMLESPEVRPLKLDNHKKMYWGKHSLSSIIETFKDFSDEEIESALLKRRGLDVGSCSESCEALI